MESYHKYLPVSPDDKQWGIYTLNVGYGKISDSSNYPSHDHPSSYYFNFKKGRVLTEYQLIYITHGQGIFESREAGTKTIVAGSIVILFPDQWHRYKPDQNAGWNEYWVGFNGEAVQNIMKHHFFSPAHPVIDIGLKEEIIELFYAIAEQAKTELAGYQPLISGTILHLLGLIYAISTQHAMDSLKDNTTLLVDRARVMFRENTETAITAEQVADELGVSYSQFRKVFKKYTGISPGQYMIQLKIEKAKRLLTLPDKLIKEVAYDLGFDCFYFSKLFKEKTGFSPAKFRERQLGHFKR